MDCEKLEMAIVDELYGELDEVTSAALKRHAASCARCASRLEGLRATRQIAVLPFVDPPPDLERRILLAVNARAASAPTRGRLAHAVSVAGSWAMRPQTAMAAVFLVMLGSAVLLLRGRSSRAPANAEMIVTEEGTPAPASPGKTDQAGALVAARPPGDLHWSESKSASPPTPVIAPEARPVDGPAGVRAAAASPPRAARSSSPPLAAAPDVRRPAVSPSPAAFAGQEASAQSVGAGDALGEARAARDAKGCRAAVPLLDDVAQRAAGSEQGWQALLESARCYRILGDHVTARSRLNGLLSVPRFRDAARSELTLIDQAATLPKR